MVAAAVAGLEVLSVVVVAPDAPSGVVEFDVAQVSIEKARAYLDGTPALVRSEIRYTQYSPYPVSTRDVALFAPAAGLEGEIAATIVAAAGAYARSVRLFDRFEKSPTEVSYGFRIAFQADDKTLEEADLVGAMTAVTQALAARGWIVR
jgi:phenylalanyl-tRNA synthetase beta subunit